jgi:hypothetical protein
MPFQLKTVSNPKDEPRIVVYANFKEFLDKASRDSKYMSHGGVLMQKKRINRDNFLEVAVEVAEGTAPAVAIPRAETLIQEAFQNDIKPGSPAKPSTEPAKATQPERVILTPPPLDFGSLGKVLSEAIASSIAGSNAKAAEAWTSALKAAVEESNTRLQTTLEGLSLTYVELGETVAKALNSGVLDQVADKRFQDIQKTLEALNEKALTEIRKDKSGIEEIRNEIDKKLGNLRVLAADIQEDSAVVMRRVGRFKLGTAELLEQQVDLLREELIKIEAQNVQLNRDVILLRGNKGIVDQERIRELEGRVAALQRAEIDAQDKELTIKRLEHELVLHKESSKKSTKAFTEHARLAELESWHRSYEETKAEFGQRITDLTQERDKQKQRAQKWFREYHLLKDRSEDVAEVQHKLGVAESRIETLSDDNRGLEVQIGTLKHDLEQRSLELHRGERHYREICLEEHRRVLFEEFERRRADFDAEKRRREDDLDHERRRCRDIEAIKDDLAIRLDESERRLHELMDQVKADLPARHQRVLDELRSLKGDDLREKMAGLEERCSSLEARKATLLEEIADREKEKKDISEQVGNLNEQVGRLVGQREAEEKAAEFLRKKREADRAKITEDLREDPIKWNGKLENPEESNWLDGIKRGIKNAGFEISDRLLLSFHTALKCQDISPLTLLMGISGTGKSELPRLYAELGGIHFDLAAVQPNWDSPADLFGFYNYAESRPKLERLSKLLLQFLPCLEELEDRPPKRGDELLLVLLDEMNLARVEYYFSELLSRLEARRGLFGNGKKLSTETHRRASIALEMAAAEQIHLFLDTNVMFVGTLNQDESTLDISDKVIDRSNAITFPRPRSFCGISDKDRRHSPVEWRLARKTWDGWCKHGTATGLDETYLASLQHRFRKINESLAHVERGVAHRVFQAVERYVAAYPVYGDKKEPQKVKDTALVDQFAMKILPKLKGIPTGTQETQDGKACMDGIRRVLPPELVDDFDKARRRDFFDWQGSEKLFDTES